MASKYVDQYGELTDAGKSALTKVVFIVVIAFFALIAFFIFKPFTSVDAGSVGVVTRFGNVQATTLSPGIHWYNPVGTSITSISTRIQKNDVKAEAASQDLQQVSIDAVVNWHLPPNEAVAEFKRVGDLDAIFTNVVSPAVNEVIKAATATMNAEDIIAQRPVLKSNIDNALRIRLAKYSIDLDDVSLVNVDFSKQFDDAIEAKQVAQQQAQQAQYDAEKATNEAQATINAAQGQAKANQLLQQSLTDQIIEQQWIQKWNGQLPTYSGGNTPLIQLPTPNK